MKKCTVCGLIKAELEFGNHGKGKLRSYCKQCASEKTKKKYWEDPEKHRRIAQERRDRDPERAARIDRKHHLKATYGITVEFYEEMVVIQNNRCAICGGERSGPGKTWHVDHSPITGVVRGLLCSRCNTGLGLFKDNVENLIAAINYIESDGIYVDNRCEG